MHVNLSQKSYDLRDAGWRFLLLGSESAGGRASWPLPGTQRCACSALAAPPSLVVPVAVILLQSILVGVLGDFHFQALRIYTREKKLLHGYYMYEVTVQPAGGTFRAGPSGRGAEGVLPQQAWS